MRFIFALIFIFPIVALGVPKKEDMALKRIPFDFVGNQIQLESHLDGSKKIESFATQKSFDDHVVTFNFKDKEVVLADKEKFIYRGPGVTLSFKVDGSMILKARVEGIPVKLNVDPKDGSTLSLNHSFIEKNNLLKARIPVIETMTGLGSQNPLKAKVAKVTSLKLGPILLKNVPARFLDEEQSKDNKGDGTIGLGVLRAFNLTVDKNKKQLILERNGLAVQPFDRSGVWFESANNTVVVKNLVKDSPAKSAGLKVGDELLTIEGTSVRHLNLSLIRDLLADPDKETINLDIKRNGIVKRATISLKDLI